MRFGTCWWIRLAVTLPEGKVSDVLEPDGIDHLGEQKEWENPKSREGHWQDRLGVAPQSISSALRARQDNVKQGLNEGKQNAFKEHNGHGKHDSIEQATLHSAFEDVRLRFPLSTAAALSQSFPFPSLNRSLLGYVLNFSHLNKYHVAYIRNFRCQHVGKFPHRAVSVEQQLPINFPLFKLLFSLLRPPEQWTFVISFLVQSPSYINVHRTIYI